MDKDYELFKYDFYGFSEDEVEEVLENEIKIQIKVRDNYFIKMAGFKHGYSCGEFDYPRLYCYFSTPKITEVEVLDNKVKRKVLADSEEGKTLVKIILKNKRFFRKFDKLISELRGELETEYISGRDDID